jgi:predicted transcriptional regulator
MPIINAQGKVFRKWEGAVNACQAQAAQLPNVEPFKAELQDILNQARQVKAQQEDNQAKRQALTQQLAELIKRGQESARRLRSYAKAQLGTKNELLVQFGAAPIRHHVRSAKKSGTDSGTPTPTPTPTPPPKAGP